MSKFNCSYKSVLKFTNNHSISHAWIALHRCVEALAHTKGEAFNNIFEFLEKEFLFERKNKDKLPTPETIIKCVEYLKIERDIFLEKLNIEIQKRKIEKKQGKRNSTENFFLGICHKQTNYTQPKVGFWGWRTLRNKN
jgi:hypothetical protein